MQLTQAQNLAERILVSMEGWTLRAEVAGSIRRRKEEVKDIEIVAIPMYGEAEDLFGHQRRNLLYDWASQMEQENRIHWIKPGISEVVRWPLNKHGKYWRGWLVRAEVKLDLFLCQSDNWGVIFLERTGSSNFNIKLVTEAPRRSGHYFSNGYLLDKQGNKVLTFEERDVFDALGLAYVEPEQRNEWPY